MASHKYWNHEKTNHCYMYSHIAWEKRNRCQVFFSHRPSSSSFCFSFIFHFAGVVWMWMVSDTYYNRSASVILDAVVFTFLSFPFHEHVYTHSIHSTVIHLWNIASVVYWIWLKGTMNKKSLENHSGHLYGDEYIPNQRINFSHIQSRNVYWLSEVSLSLKHSW